MRFPKEKIVLSFKKSSYDLSEYKKNTTQKENKIKKISRNNIMKIKSRSRFLGKFFLEIKNEKKYYMVYLNTINNFENISMIDCTESTIRENNLIENKIKNKLLSKIAHEFKTPLNNIIGILTTIFINCKDKDLLKELMIVHSLTNYTIFLVNDIILYAEDRYIEKSENEDINIIASPSDEISIISLSNLSKINSNYKSFTRKVDISNCLFFCFDILNALLSCNEYKKDMVKIELRIDKRLKNLIIYSDELKINQILLNFISNSLKYTKDGSIYLIANLTEKEGRNHLRISCVDTGFGISESEQKELFQEKISLDTKHEFNNKGSGIGLSICRKLAENLNIILEFCSKENLGSEFSILFPLVKISKSKSINFNQKIFRNKNFAKENLNESIINLKESNLINNNYNECIQNQNKINSELSSLKYVSFKRSFSFNDIYNKTILDSNLSIDYLKGIDELEKNNIPYVSNVKNLEDYNYRFKEEKKEKCPNKIKTSDNMSLINKENKDLLGANNINSGSLPPKILKNNKEIIDKDDITKMNNLSLKRFKTDFGKKTRIKNSSKSLVKKKKKNSFNNLITSKKSKIQKNEDDIREKYRYSRSIDISDFNLKNNNYQEDKKLFEEKNNLLKFSNNIYQIYNISSNEAFHKKSSRFSKFNSSSNLESDKDKISHSKISNSCNSISSFQINSNSLKEFNEKNPLSGKYEKEIVQMNVSEKRPNNFNIISKTIIFNKLNFDEKDKDKEKNKDKNKYKYREGSLLISLSDNLNNSKKINEFENNYNYNDDENNINFKQKTNEIKSNNSISIRSSNNPSLYDNVKNPKFSNYPYRGKKIIRIKENPDLIKSIKFNIKDINILYDIHKIEDKIVGGNSYHIIKEEDSESQRYDILKDSKLFSNSFFNSELGIKEEKKDSSQSNQTSRNTSNDNPYSFTKNLKSKEVYDYNGRKIETNLKCSNKDLNLFRPYNRIKSCSMPLLIEENEKFKILQNNILVNEFLDPREFCTIRGYQPNGHPIYEINSSNSNSLNFQGEFSRIKNKPRYNIERKSNEVKKDFIKEKSNKFCNNNSEIQISKIKNEHSSSLFNKNIPENEVYHIIDGGCSKADLFSSNMASNNSNNFSAYNVKSSNSLIEHDKKKDNKKDKKNKECKFSMIMENIDFFTISNKEKIPALIKSPQIEKFESNSGKKKEYSRKSFDSSSKSIKNTSKKYQSEENEEDNNFPYKKYFVSKKKYVYKSKSKEKKPNLNLYNKLSYDIKKKYSNNSENEQKKIQEKKINNISGNEENIMKKLSSVSNNLNFDVYKKTNEVINKEKNLNLKIKSNPKINEREIEEIKEKEINLVKNFNFDEEKELYNLSENKEKIFKCCCLTSICKHIQKPEINHDPLKRYLLVIDDNMYIRKTLCNLISITFRKLEEEKKIKYKFEVIEGSDGIDVLNLAINRGIASKIKAVFIDENMEYLNGSESVRIIRNLQNLNKISKFSIASVTAFEDLPMKNYIKNSGIDEVYSKPLSKSQLLDFLDRYKILV
jgi:signal transduction histidine kinase